MWKKLKNNKKKGFTLVELIVVLVILAILAALLIPALVGYIDKAKEKQVTAETRQVVMAAQTLVDEEYGKLPLNSGTIITVAAGGTIELTDVADLAEVPVANITSVTVTDSRVTGVQYVNGKTCVYAWTAVAGGTYTIQ